MALLDVFKKRKEKEKFDKKEREKLKTEISEETKEEKTEALKKASVFTPPFGGTKIIVKPHIAEKSTILNEKGVYVFKVKPKANKVMIKREIKKIYGKAPVKVNIVNLPSRKVFIRGKQRIKPGFKKAVIFFKKGEKIDIA